MPEFRGELLQSEGREHAKILGYDWHVQRVTDRPMQLGQSELNERARRRV